MPRVLFEEFRDQYENTRYPFMDTALMTDSNEGITIPDNIFLDAGFCFPEGFPYLSSIEVNNTSALFTITSGSDTAECRMGFDSIPNILRFRTSRGKYIGCMVSEKGRLAWFAALPVGTYLFYPEHTSFATRCNIRSGALGVASLGVDETSLIGDVWLVGGNGVFLRNVDGKIEIDILGEVLYKRKKCNDPDSFETPKYLKSINGVFPDEHGNIQVGFYTEDRKSTIRFITRESGIEIKRINER